MILVDSNGEGLSYNNIDPRLKLQIQVYIQKLIAKFEKENEPYRSIR